MTPDDLARWAFSGAIAAVLLGLPVGLLIAVIWMGGATASQAVGDWLIRWRLASRPCNHHHEEKR